MIPLTKCKCPFQQRPLRRHRPRPSLHRFHLLPPHHRPNLQGFDFVKGEYDAGASFRFFRGQKEGVVCTSISQRMRGLRFLSYLNIH